MEFTRAAKVHGPPEAEGFMLHGFVGREALGRPFHYEIDLLHTSPNVDLASLLGQQLGVVLKVRNGKLRHFNGFVTHFSLVGGLGRYALYRAVLRPWIWLLSHSYNCRVFATDLRKKSVLDAVEEVFAKYEFGGARDFALGKREDYRKFGFLVQYRESDFNFVSRLFEQEGIFYFHRHTELQHTLVLADPDAAKKEVIEDYESVAYYPPLPSELREEDHIDGMTISRQIRPGVFESADFEFRQPPRNREGRFFGRRHSPLANSLPSFEVYDYPGLLVTQYPDSLATRDNADPFARMGLEERQADYEVVEGTGNCRGLSPGARFTLRKFPIEEQNREYLVTETSYDLRLDDYESSSVGDTGPVFRCSFRAIPGSTRYRPPRITPKPVVEGPQTAVVVGPPKAEGTDKEPEIHTDPEGFGQVRVQFHWDREGEYNEKSSCWVRVGQIWAGSNMGGVHIPRIGQEVIVDFLEGDPDRPIITGRVYNGSNKAPFGFGDTVNESGLRSHSTLKGGQDNYNEIRFDDTKDEELFYVQAERDHSTLVKHDKKSMVKANRFAGITLNDTKIVGGDTKLVITGNMSVAVGDPPNAEVSGKDAPQPEPRVSSHKVTGKHTLDATQSIDLQAPDYIKLTCVGSSIHIEPGKITLRAGDGACIVMDANIVATSAGGASMTMDPSIFMKANGQGTVLIDATVTAESADHSRLQLDADALLASSSANATMYGESKATMSGGSGGSIVEGTAQGLKLNSPKIDATGTSLVTVMAPTIKIG